MNIRDDLAPIKSCVLFFSFAGIVRRSTTVEYSTDGKFPVKTTNALGYSETKTFDTKTGNVLTLTGPNGLCG
jgi:hypothetical protein